MSKKPLTEREANQRFADGVKSFVGLRLWRWCYGRSGDKSQRKFANRLGIHPSRVTVGLRDGELRLATLVLILTELEIDLPDLPPVLKKRALAVYGYIAVLERLAGREISIEDFCLIWSLRKHRPFLRLMIKAKEIGLTPEEDKRFLELTNQAIEYGRGLLGDCRGNKVAESEKFLEGSLERIDRLRAEWIPHIDRALELVHSFTKVSHKLYE